MTYKLLMHFLIRATSALCIVMWPTPKLILFVIMGILVQLASANEMTMVGINYGMVADNLPPPKKAMHLLFGMGVTKVKIYNVNTTVLKVFMGTGISFIVGVGNEELHGLAINAQAATTWVKENIEPWATMIKAIAVGNEVLTTDDPNLISDLIPAMENIHAALGPLSQKIAISTPHAMSVLEEPSFPPSSARFKSVISQSVMRPLLLFLSRTQAPFMINAYPFFAYKAQPSTIPLPYVLFQPNAGLRDPVSSHIYYNMLDAQIDAIYTAIFACAGLVNVKIIVTETGWPSSGDLNEPGATQLNAQTYNSNLIKYLSSHLGTPLQPKIPIQAYIFAFFNEDSKPGPASERNYGLFRPNCSEVYDLGLMKDNTMETSSNNLHHHLHNNPSGSNSSRYMKASCWLLTIMSVVALVIFGNFSQSI